MKKFVLGDIHGSFKALKQVLERSSFDYKKDKLFFLGDIPDGWSQTKECIEELMKIDNLVYIKGNHCYWLDLHFCGLLNKLSHQRDMRTWLMNGGESTLKSLDGISHEQEDAFKNFIEKAVSYHIEDGNLFLHAGYNFNVPIEKNFRDDLMWDRNMVKHVFSNQQKQTIDENYKNIFVGHTPLQSFNSNKFNPLIPQRWANVWLMDTGCAFNGCLSMMDLETNEVFSSDRSMELYPDERGRNQFSFNEINSKKDETNI